MVVGIEESGNVLGEVLAVAVHRNSVGETCLQGRAETCLQGVTLAAVAVVVEQADVIQRAKHRSCSVIAAVVDDKDIGAIAQRVGHDLSDRTHIVVRRYDDADAAGAQPSPDLLQFLFFFFPLRLHFLLFCVFRFRLIALPFFLFVPNEWIASPADRRKRRWRTWLSLPSPLPLPTRFRRWFRLP